MMKKGMWKGRGIIVVLSVFVAVLCMGVGFTSQAGTLYESPYVDFTPDGFAWTVKEPIGHAYYLEYFYKEGVTPEYWYPKGERIETGITSSLREPGVGEHYYDTKRMGEVPVKYWEVWHPMGGCVHDDCTASQWHGVPNVGPEGLGHSCKKGYYSGWFAYCADCNEKLIPALVYMSRDAARSITSIDVDKGYYYSCPSCSHIENTMGVLYHECQAISFNQYKVVYDKNVENVLEVGGIMDASLHMYNNEDVYEGEQITPITRLSTNVYRRLGYAFAGWNTEPDGSGTHYDDCAEIFNLSVYDCDEDPERGTVTLYAQWVEAKSILNIDPNGGTYKGNKNIVSMEYPYGTTMPIYTDDIEPPHGYVVNYDLQGGSFKEETENPVLVEKVFNSWQLSEPFYGKLRQEISYYCDYAFLGPDGIEDTLTALYDGGTTILPDAEKKDYAFGGWFEDKECTKPVGFAGQEYTPKADTTLYAQWVNLVLYSEKNYIDNDKKGAVDLSWTQKDNLAKSYKLYESVDGDNFTLLYGAKKTIDLDSLAQNFAYKGATQTYTVQYSGFYELKAYGGQGGNYTRVLSDGSVAEYIGGKGGEVTARVYLNAGEVLTVAAGGRGGSNAANKGGYSGGGKGSLYGSGGGVTFIRSDQKGILLMAGGGGGAGANAHGGAGGAQESLVESSTSGENGQAGGGAGYRGGKAGEYIVHNHTLDACYEKTDADYDFSAFPGNTEVICRFPGNDSENVRVSSKIITGGHTSDWVENRAYIKVGTYAKPIPTNGNTKLTIPFHYYGWGGNGYIKEGACLKVWDQTGRELGNFDLSRDDVEGVHGSVKAYSIGTEAAPKNYEISLPEGTTGVYIYFDLPINNQWNNESDNGTWASFQVNALEFTGGAEYTLKCLLMDGEIISSKPGYGGSSYVNANHAVSYQMSPGVREGHGTASIKAVSVGYMNTLSLKGVPAPDLAAPDKISTEPERITMEADGDKAVKVTFEAPMDNGTPYWYRAESYKDGTEEKLCDSNITTETLTTGVAGYYYILDTNPAKTVTAFNADNKGNLLEQEEKKNTSTVRVHLVADTMYLHVAAVDVAGNVGPTADIEVGMDDLAWSVTTDQINVTDVINGVDKDTVYQKDANTFYVRADGSGPFLLSYKSFLKGEARDDYQIDYQIFDVAMTEGKNQRYITRLPYSIPVGSEDNLAVSDFVRQMTGDSILKDAMNTGAYRKRDSKDNYFYQAFAIPKSFHGKTMVVTPVAGATFKEEIRYSEWSDDTNHSVTLIADGEGPVISGTDILDDLDWIGKDEGSVCLQISATDDLSGVKELKVVIANRDNHSTREYFPDENGVLTLNITKDEVIFNGDFGVTISATDFVGNKTQKKYEITELALTAEVKRILQPHEPIFKSGESGILTITAWGYVERIEVEFPEEFVRWNQELNKVYYYTDASQYRREESLQFMVPLGVWANQKYTITVRAYKGDKMLEEYPALSTVENGGSVLDELRTRLR